jgi:hypothetical protein
MRMAELLRLKANPKIGRAEAFRISMREMIEKGSRYRSASGFLGAVRRGRRGRGGEIALGQHRVLTHDNASLRWLAGARPRPCSLCSARLMRRRTAPAIGPATRANVAVSRAKATLHVAGNRELWRNHGSFRVVSERLAS